MDTTPSFRYMLKISLLKCIVLSFKFKIMKYTEFYLRMEHIRKLFYHSHRRLVLVSLRHSVGCSPIKEKTFVAE
jgi:hypothetical protein